MSLSCRPVLSINSENISSVILVLWREASNSTPSLRTCSPTTAKSFLLFRRLARKYHPAANPGDEQVHRRHLREV